MELDSEGRVRVDKTNNSSGHMSLRIDLTMKSSTTKFPKEKIKEYISDFGGGKISIVKEKNNKLDSIKIKNYCSSEDNSKGVKR